MFMENVTPVLLARSQVTSPRPTGGFPSAALVQSLARILGRSGGKVDVDCEVMCFGLLHGDAPSMTGRGTSGNRAITLTRDERWLERGGGARANCERELGATVNWKRPDSERFDNVALACADQSRPTRTLQLTRPSVAALLRGLAAERQSLCRHRRPA